MIRKLSATTFLALLSLVIACQHPALGYCFCSDHFFLTDCECSEYIEATPPCSCCPSSEQLPEPSSPYKDCCKKISWDPGDLLWSPSEGHDPPEHFISPLSFPGESQTHSAFFEFADQLPKTRPPPDHLALYLRLGVMRL